MPNAYRIVKKKRAKKAFDGEGARRFGGRWNHEGTSMVYASERLSLAALETFVHIEQTPLHFELVYFEISYPDTLPIELLTNAQLTKFLKNSTTQNIGSQWINHAATSVMIVPSVIIPSEYNVLLNPQHTDYKKIKISKPRLFSFDNRMWK